MGQTYNDVLGTTARAMVAPGKGVLAVDETPRTLTSRFQALGITSTEESRRDYRELLFRTPGIADRISGVILNDETARQQAADGTPMVRLLAGLGMLPGVKVDKGLFPLAGAPEEVVTEGLDGLRPRLQEYREMGIAFTKWRAVFTITGAAPQTPGEHSLAAPRSPGVSAARPHSAPQTPGDHSPGVPQPPGFSAAMPHSGTPTQRCIEANAHALARYAALVQEAGLVPIVETEVLLDGAHSIDACYRHTEAVLRAVFGQLAAQGALLEGMVLKPNMVLSGKDAAGRAGPEEVAEQTVACLMRTVPPAVPGIAFLSGGQTDEDATRNLDAICRLGRERGAPWQLSFSFARALQGEPMRVWGGDPAKAVEAQQAFRRRADATSAARQGAYRPERETAEAGRRREVSP